MRNNSQCKSGLVSLLTVISRKAEFPVEVRNAVKMSLKSRKQLMHDAQNADDASTKRAKNDHTGDGSSAASSSSSVYVPTASAGAHLMNDVVPMETEAVSSLPVKTAFSKIPLNR